MVTRAYTRLAQVAKGKRMPPIYDEASLWYQGWYFQMRLEEEVERSSRYKLPLTVVVICLPVQAAQDRSGLNLRLSDVITFKRLRRSDIPGVISDHELAVFLPHTQPDQAENVVKRLKKSLARYQPSFGIASFPEDSEEAPHLLMIAERRALAQIVDGGLTANAIRPRRRAVRPTATEQGAASVARAVTHIAATHPRDEP